MNQRPQHVLITGGTGYIGRRLVRFSRSRGWHVTLLTHSASSTDDDPGVRLFHWTLEADPPDAAFRTDNGFPSVDTVIHLAHQWHSGAADEQDLNVPGTGRLLAAARMHGVRRFVFASTPSARRDAPNHYGRTKWAIEQLLQTPDEVAARIGLVYGGTPAAMWGVLCRVVQIGPVLPMLGIERLVQPVHRDEVCRGLLALAERKTLDRRVFGLASPSPIAFGEFLKVLAREKFGRRLRLVPIPLWIALNLADISQKVPFLPTINRERILGLSAIQPMACAEDLAELGLTISDPAAGLASEMSDRRRRLLVEGAVLLRYVLGRFPECGVLKRYARGVCVAGDGRPLLLPAVFRVWPPLLRLFDPILGDSENPEIDSLQSRLGMAVLLVDASQDGASQLYDYAGSSGIRAGLRLISVLILEALLMPARFLLGRLFKW